MPNAISVDDARFKTFSGGLTGSVVLPGEARYDLLRTPWLQVIDQRPALIVEAACVDDIVAAVNFARAESLELGLMSTGHGIAAACSGLLLRLSKMANVAVDTASNIATFGPGAVSSELLKATEKHGLVYPAGQVGNVGVIGFALGGGIGWLVRRLGGAADSIVGADVVLADGSVVRADADNNPDLFWALRGGGGNFGIVVSLEIRLTPLSGVVGGEIYFPLDRAPELLRFYRDWSSKLTDDMSTIFRLTAVPPDPSSPEELRGQRVCMFGVCHSNTDTADAVFGSLQSLGKPLLNDVKKRTLSSMARLEPASHIPGAPAYGQVEHLKLLSDEVIDALARTARTMIPPLMQFEIQQLGGALAGVAHHTRGAFEPSSAAYLLHIESMAVNATLPELAKVTTNAFAALGDAYTGEKYYNFLRGDEQPDVGHAFGPSKFERLREIKRRFDPANVFHLNLNIEPALAVKA